MTNEKLKSYIETKRLYGEIKVLKSQNHLLTVENKGLKSKVETSDKKYEELEISIDEKINKAVNLAVAKVTEHFNKKVSKLEKENKKQAEEIKRLKSQINKDSSNSSKPSSTNGFKTVIQNNREKSGKSVGGQKGHKGYKLELPPNLKELIENKKLEHKVIDYKKEGIVYTEEYISKYVIDLEIKTILNEHRFYKNIDGIFDEIPEDLKNEVSYGVNIKSLSTVLSNEGIIANKRLSSFFKSVSNEIIDMSTATVISFNKLLSKKLDETNQLEIIENNLLNGDVLYVDDTVRKTTEIPDEDKREREDRKIFRGCLRNYSNELNTLYTYNAKKDEAGIIADNILPRYHGIVAHDHESKYYIYGDLHSTCHPHLNRELKSVFENLKIDSVTDLISFFNNLNKEKKELIKRNINQKSASDLKNIDKEYDEIVNKAWLQIKPLKNKYYYSDTVTLLMRMEDYKENYLLFINDFRAPYSNNLSERDLRPTKTQEKVSGVLRSFEGGKIYAKNRSFISTIKKRKMNIFESIKSILNGNPVLN